MKRALEEAARREKQTVSAFLERIVSKSLGGTESWPKKEAALQEQLHASAMRLVGKISGRRPDRSTRVRELVRRNLRDRMAVGEV